MPKSRRLQRKVLWSRWSCRSTAPDEYTDLAIQSAVNQSYRNLEIIVVDDGSGGDAAERLDKWAAADPRIKVVLNPENSGAYTSRNIGYSKALRRIPDNFRRGRLATSAEDRTAGPCR